MGVANVIFKENLPRRQFVNRFVSMKHVICPAVLMASSLAPTASITHAASVQAQSLDELELISVTGDIAAGDEEKFRELSLKFPKAVVTFNSPGGALAPALEIGRMIRLRNYPTVVLDKNVCASACALMWLAGTPRFLDPTAKLGFHASYRKVNGRLIESGVSNALVGHYLSQLSLPPQTVVFASSASPKEILWLTDENKKISGIEFQAFKTIAAAADSNDGGVAPPAPSKPALPKIPAFTPVELVIEAELGSKMSVSGNMFPIRLARSIIIDNRVVVLAGARGMGEVVHAKKAGGSGSSGELILAARYLEVNGQKLRLRSMQLSLVGQDEMQTSMASSALIGPLAFAISGKDTIVPLGKHVMAKTAEDFPPESAEIAGPEARESKDVPTDSPKSEAGK